MQVLRNESGSFSCPVSGCSMTYSNKSRFTSHVKSCIDHQNHSFNLNLAAYPAPIPKVLPSSFYRLEPEPEPEPVAMNPSESVPIAIKEIVLVNPESSLLAVHKEIGLLICIVCQVGIQVEQETDNPGLSHLKSHHSRSKYDSKEVIEILFCYSQSNR